MRPSDILKNVEDRYWRCRSYSDTGSVVTSCPAADTIQDIRMTFNTRFSQGGPFSYEWTLTNIGSFRIWTADQILIKILTPQNEMVEAPSLLKALEVSAGVSKGGSVLVPKVLASQSLDSVIPQKNVTLRRAALSGQECYLLESNDPDSDYTEIWIRDDFMIQKLRKVERMSVELQLQLFRDAAAVIPSIGLREPINDLESFTDYHYSDIEISF